MLNDRVRAPFLAEHPELTLSLSHSHAYAVAVLARHPIGVDLEKIEPRPEALALYFCTSDEQSYLERGRPQPEQRDVEITRLLYWSR